MEKPGRKYRLGLAEAYVFPADLVNRLIKRREQWDITQRNRRAELEQALKDWDKANQKPNKKPLPNARSARRNWPP